MEKEMATYFSILFFFFFPFIFMVHWEDPEGSSGQGGERGNQDEEYM